MEAEKEAPVTFLLPESDCLCWLLFLVIICIFTKGFIFSVQLVNVGSHMYIYT